MPLVDFFFFQAEDGIRAGHVTGVQTCALPILLSIRHFSSKPNEKRPCWNDSFKRSEERRVGKESRFPMAPESGKTIDEKDPTRIIKRKSGVMDEDQSEGRQ